MRTFRHILQTKYHQQSDHCTGQHFSQIGDHSRRFLSFREYDKRQKSRCHSPQDHYHNRYDLLCYCHSHSVSLLSGYIPTVMPDILLTSVYVLFFSSPHASSFPGSIKRSMPLTEAYNSDQRRLMILCIFPLINEHNHKQRSHDKIQ